MNAQLDEIKLGKIDESKYCRYDLYSPCVRGDNDLLTCAKCTADSFRDIARF
jgi:hypothetical protein